MPADRHVLGVAISSKPSSAVRARAQLDGLLLGKIRVGWRRAAKLPFFARTFDGPLLYAALVADLVAALPLVHELIAPTPDPEVALALATPATP